MYPKTSLGAVTKKELSGYFSSPTALIFLGTYLVASLFSFFWIEKFFQRNIADLRPLFDGMPLFMVFLTATLTMKSWSEERRMGTVEFLMTLPLPTWQVVLGKFLACLSLVGLALLMTWSLAFTVGFLGDVDWGPVLGAYGASLLLAGAYIAIGLFMSSTTDNQIVSLILTVLACGILYILGSDTLLNLVGHKGGALLKALGSGSRFTSMARGVLDLRDVYYYFTFIALGLLGNIFVLERHRWSCERGEQDLNHRNYTLRFLLIVANLFAAHGWVQEWRNARLDLTQDHMYSLSPATKDLLDQLQEPLLIRGYFSERTHPLLSPLVPVIRDFLQEYENLAQGKVRAEFLDPRSHESIEAEASRKYNIEPVPFQVADRHSAAMVNSYFNILVQYGDKFQVLNFQDLIEIQHDGLGKIDVQLRNLEYDIDRSILKVMKEFSNSDQVFEALPRDVKIVGYVSHESLPKKLLTLHGELKTLLNDWTQKSKKITVEYLDPLKDKDLGEKIASEYGFVPQIVSLFAREPFYYYLAVQDGDRIYPVDLPEELSIGPLQASLLSTLKRVIPGYMRTVGISTPPSSSMMNPMMGAFSQPQEQKSFKAIQQKLEERYTTDPVNLEQGFLDPKIDILMVLAPKNLEEKAIFAMDQFLMKGGTVVLAANSVSVNKNHMQGVSSEAYDTGLENWLAHHGIDIPKALVMDMENTGFPAIRKRMVQNVTVREAYLAPYPFFVDIRKSGFGHHGMLGGLSQVNMPWTSPILVDKDKNSSRTVVPLLTSSSKSWKTEDLNLEAHRELYPEVGFPMPEKFEPQTLAVLVEGKFSSYFAGKDSPLLPEKKEDSQKITRVLSSSSDKARLVVLGSYEALADETLQIFSMVNGTSQHLNSLQFLENIMDWSMEEPQLLAMRSHSHLARTLYSLTDEQKTIWEWTNYVAAFLGILSIFVIHRVYRSRRKQKIKDWVAESSQTAGGSL